jgi:hypothetical protein
VLLDLVRRLDRLAEEIEQSGPLEHACEPARSH